VIEKEELPDAVKTSLLIVSIALFVIAIGIMLYEVVNYYIHGPTFRICDVVIYVNNSTVPVRLYYAWNERLMAEGYRNKDSYDFLGKGAVGMLFIVNYSSVEITMKDVKLPLIAVLYERADSPQKLIPIPDCGGQYCEPIPFAIYLEPGKEYPIPRVYAFVEYSPEFYYRYLNGAMHVLEIRECR